MGLRQLRRECAARVRQLDVPVPFDSHQLCRQLAQARGRPIHLLAMALDLEGPCGLWIAADRADYILYERRTSRLHQEHIIAHEIGHLLCDHEPVSALDDATTSMLMPSLDPRMVRRILRRRSGYPVPQEQQAEMIASLLLQRSSGAVAATGPADGPAAAAAPETAGVIARLELSLERHPPRRSTRG